MAETEKTADNKRAVQRLYDAVWSDGDLDLVNDLLSPDFTHLGPAVSDHDSGPDGYKEFVGMFRTGFPDTRIEIVESIAEGNTVAVRWVGHGTHEEELMGIEPTNRRVANPGVSFVRFENDAIAEIWDIYDTYDLLRQLGVAESVGE